MFRSKALITGVLGQDGSYLAEFLLSIGYQVVGTTQNKLVNSQYCKYNSYSVIFLDLKDTQQVRNLILEFKPDEVYNFAAKSSSSQLFDHSIEISEINGLAPARFLEAIRELSPQTRFCQAGSSELFAGVTNSPQSEKTCFIPVNTYGVAKVLAANMISVFRNKYNIFATNAILYNHESPRRKLEYVTRRITHTVAEIAYGKCNKLIIGNLDSRRDWGFAGDYVRGMWMMLQSNKACDYIISSGKTHSVREFCDIAFSHVGLNYRNFIEIDSKWDRRVDLIELCGDSKKIRNELGWQPTINFEQLVKMMVDEDLRLMS